MEIMQPARQLILLLLLLFLLNLLNLRELTHQSFEGICHGSATSTVKNKTDSSGKNTRYCRDSDDKIDSHSMVQNRHLKKCTQDRWAVVHRFR
jgi:hypothetical protein